MNAYVCLYEEFNMIKLKPKKMEGYLFKCIGPNEDVICYEKTKNNKKYEKYNAVMKWSMKNKIWIKEILKMINCEMNEFSDLNIKIKFVENELCVLIDGRLIITASSSEKMIANMMFKSAIYSRLMNPRYNFILIDNLLETEVGKEIIKTLNYKQIFVFTHNKDIHKIADNIILIENKTDCSEIVIE